MLCVNISISFAAASFTEARQENAQTLQTGAPDYSDSLAIFFVFMW